MKFRPCIDIHNGEVKQIVGGSLKDAGNYARENFVSSYDAAFYAKLYKDRNLPGGHVILLNPEGSEYYEKTKSEALNALKAYPGGLDVGGGINPLNAGEFLDAGARHVIVTSYVFKDGKLNEDALSKMVDSVGAQNLILDLSCRKKDGSFFIVTDRWQKFTDIELTEGLMDELSLKCDGFLIHAADVEGKVNGIEEDVVKILASSVKPVTYAGGVHSYEDLELIKRLGNDRVDVTIGSALDIFGGSIEFERVVDLLK